MATFYIDPDYGSGGDGSESTPFDSWADVTWTAGNTYLQKRGTVFGGDFAPNASGTAAAYITIGSYGTGARPEIRRTPTTGNNGCILLSSRSYFRISGLTLTGATNGTGAGILMLNSSNIEIDDCDSDGNMWGFRIDHTGSADLANFTLTNSIAQNSMQAGLVVVPSTTSGGTLSDITVEDNRFLNNGLVGSTYYNVFFASRVATTGAFDATKAIYNVHFNRNVVSGSLTYGVSFRYVSGGEFTHNEVTGSGLAQTGDIHSAWFGGCRGMLVGFNRVHDNFGNVGGASGSGVGIFVDQGATTGTGHGCQRMRVIGNHVYRQGDFENTASYASAGIIVYKAQDCTVSGNLVHDCRNGIAVFGSSVENTARVGVYNNTCANIREIAFGIGVLADAVTSKNNIALSSGVGFFEESGANAVTNATRDYNDAYDCTMQFGAGTLAAMTAGSAGTNDIEDDPLLNASYRPRFGSPVIESGTKVAGVRLYDHYGKEIDKTPDIGAIQVYAARSASATRSAITRTEATRDRSGNRAAYG